MDVGVEHRPSTGNGVHYGTGWTIGGHLRVDIFRWLGVRFIARVEEANDVSFDDGSLGLPRGTDLDQPSLQRVLLGLSIEPTWNVTRKLDLWAGVGANWGRTIADRAAASGAQSLLLPPRAAVFVEVPFSLGARYELLDDWLVVNACGTLGLLADQSGSMISPYPTPGASGQLVTVGAFPELGTSWTFLVGVGALL